MIETYPTESTRKQSPRTVQVAGTNTDLLPQYNPVEQDAIPTTFTTRRLKRMEDRIASTNSETSERDDLPDASDYHLEQLIGPEVIKANQLNDEVVHGLYGKATTFFDGVIERASDNKGEAIQFEIQKSINTKAEGVERHEQIDAQADHMVAAINRWREREKQRETIDKNGYISESERNRIAAKFRFGTISGLSQAFKTEIANREIRQEQYKNERDRLIEIGNGLVAQRDERKLELINIQEELAKNKEKLEGTEEIEDTLLGKENELLLKAKREREKVAKPFFREIDDQFAELQEEESDTTPAGIEEAKRNILNSVTSDKLDLIMEELEQCHLRQKHTRKSIENYEHLIEAGEYGISSINDELEQLDALILQVKDELVQIKRAQATIKEHSIRMEDLAEKFEITVKSHAKKPIGGDPTLIRLWEMMEENQRMLSIDDDNNDKVAVFDTEQLLDVIGCSADSDFKSAILYDLDAVNTIKQVDEQLDAARSVNPIYMVKKIGKGIVKNALTLTYKNNGDSPR